MTEMRSFASVDIDAGADMQYENLVQDIFRNGEAKSDRTGVGTKSLFGQRLEYDISRRIPVITTKKTAFKLVIEELLWFLSGSTNIKPLQDQGNRIWDQWANAATGELGPIYGNQWRTWGGRGIDQIAKLVETIKTNPNSRRQIVSAWNVEDLSRMALEPCHILFQTYLRERGQVLDLQVYQRSADMFLGVPFNLASYAVLCHLLAKVTGKLPGKLIWIGGDCHIYNNHFNQVDLMLRRLPYPFPRLRISNRVESIDDLKVEDFNLDKYECHDAIKAPVAV